MGCDIHAYRERLVNEAWTPEQEFKDVYGDGDLDVDWRERFTDRNYNLFGLLCKGVRTEHQFSLMERGIPFDISPEVKSVIDRYGGDGHSHSYIYLHELKSLLNFLDGLTVRIEGMKERSEIEALQQSINSDEDTNWELLYPYCKWSNDPKCEDFNFDVPALFIIGGGIKKLISSFSETSCLQRLVFFFDN